MVAKTFKCFGFCLVAAFFTMAGVAGVSAGDAENDKIVTVNTNQIIQKHPVFLEARQTLQREAQQIQEQMEGKSQQEKQGQRLSVRDGRKCSLGWRQGCYRRDTERDRRESRRLRRVFHTYANEFSHSGLSAALGHELGSNGVRKNGPIIMEHA